MRKRDQRKTDARYPTPGEEFDPLSQTWTTMGQSRDAVKRRQIIAAQKAEAAWLARHFQLDERGRLPGDEGAQNLSVQQRKERIVKMTAFPRIPDHELQELERLIAAYGMPLAALSSDTAAFIIRRVMLDFHRLTTLRRNVKPGLFTVEELVELMRVLQVQPAQLAQITSQDTAGFHAANGSIHRWLHEASRPTGTYAMRINRLIEQHVRRKGAKGFPGKRPDSALSQEPGTVDRRTRKRRQEQASAMDVPLSSAALEARRRKEEADGGA